MSVIVDLLGLTIAPEEKKMLTHSKTSGVILFSRNIQDKNQLSRLIADIHEINPEPIICVDHEGGYVQRIQRLGFRALPPARLYGDVYDLDAATGLELAERYGKIMADDLLDFGIHLSFAPILDIHGENTIIAGLDRAFHVNPDVITRLASAFIKGMHKAGMPSVGKHFPGHGFCTDDSHISQPKDKRSLDEIKSHDLKPFISLIESNLLDAVMPAHITYPSIDDKFPAGFSSIWLQDILRSELGFDGLIISDCLGMTGADIGDLLTRGTQALKAGCNLLIAANQKREVLQKFLDELPETYHQNNQPYIKGFREKMCARQAIHTPDKPPTQIDAANPTQTI